MVRAIFAFFLALALPAFASVTFVRGQELNHQLSLCLEKQDAIAIINEDATKGFDAAAAIWNANEKCMSLPVTGGPKVGRVVHEREVTRDGQKITAKVVEILDADGKTVLAYFMTTGVMAAGVTPEIRGRRS